MIGEAESMLLKAQANAAVTYRRIRDEARPRTTRIALKDVTTCQVSHTLTRLDVGSTRTRLVLTLPSGREVEV